MVMTLMKPLHGLACGQGLNILTNVTFRQSIARVMGHNETTRPILSHDAIETAWDAIGERWPEQVDQLRGMAMGQQRQLLSGCRSS
jgi:hypothetical protein